MDLIETDGEVDAQPGLAHVLLELMGMVRVAVLCSRRLARQVDILLQNACMAWHQGESTPLFSLNGSYEQICI